MSSDPRIGTQIGDYRIEQMLGRGGMSVVYLAEHIRLKRKAALKLLSPELAEDPTFRSRFVSEWERLAQLDHPNIIPIFEAGEAEGLLYIAMRYVRSTDLKALMDHEGRLDPARAVSIVSQTASALDAAHEQSLVHRDVKPANILIAIGAGPEGTDHVYLSDFGLTKHTESKSGLTQTGHFMGTIDYVAPEQIAGKDVDGRTDEYALACVLYFCLTGKVPFPREEETAALFAHLQDAPPRVTEARPEVSVGIDDVIAKAMSKQKDERYESCTAFARAARQALNVAGSPSAGMQVPPAAATVLASAPAAPMATASTLPEAPATEPPLPPLHSTPPVPSPSGSGGSKRGLMIGGVVAAAVALGVLAITQLGGGDEPGPTASTGATGVTTPTGSTGGQPSPVPTVLVFDGFADNAFQWETQPQNNITREIVDDRYRFVVTDQAPPDAFAVSVGATRSFDIADTRVATNVVLADKGGGGIENGFGVTCRYTGADGYYFLIGSSGRWSIQKLVGDEAPVELASAPNDVAIRPGVGAPNLIEATCIGGAEVTLTLTVNGNQVVSLVDDVSPIVSGGGGVAVVGQAGLVVEFEDFEFTELTFLD